MIKNGLLLIETTGMMLAETNTSAKETEKWSFKMFMGTRHTFVIVAFLSSIALLFLLVKTQIVPYELSQIWPLLVILSGAMLLALGYSRDNCLQVSYIVPGIVLFGLGIVFSLFSFDIIIMPFAEFAQYWWPVVFILFGIVLIALLGCSKKQKNFLLFGESDEDDNLF